MKISRDVERTLGPYYRTMELIHAPDQKKKAAEKIQWFLEEKVKPEKDWELSVFYYGLYAHLMAEQIVVNHEKKKK